MTGNGYDRANAAIIKAVAKIDCVREDAERRYSPAALALVKALGKDANDALTWTTHVRNAGFDTINAM